MCWRRKPQILIEDGRVLVFTEKRINAKQRAEFVRVFLGSSRCG